MTENQTGNWCIFYRKMSDPSGIWYTMKLWRKDGVLVSAKTYNDVHKFSKYKEAWNFARNLLSEEPIPHYDATVKRVCRQRGSGFYLAGS